MRADLSCERIERDLSVRTQRYPRVLLAAAAANVQLAPACFDHAEEEEEEEERKRMQYCTAECGMAMLS